MAEPGLGQPCPCGSGLELAACCGLLHLSGKATTAEVLMRSRYVAYVLGNTDYLRATWHPDTCPQSFSAEATRWLGLSIRKCERGQAGDSEGTVEFEATFRDGDRVKVLHETSRFVYRDGCWLYADGKPKLRDFGRNEPCPCGSGRKFKRCCGRQGE